MAVSVDVGGTARPCCALFPIVISGNERLGWDQIADSDAQIATFRYVAYVDNVAVELTGASCGRPSPKMTFSCSAPLPPLSPGFHTVGIATRIAGSSRQSGQSNSLMVLVVGPGQARAERTGPDALTLARHVVV